MIKDFLKSHPIHKSIAPYLDLIMIPKLTLFFCIWPMICVGMHIGSFINNSTNVNITAVDPLTSILFIGITFIFSSISISNHIYDADVDKINEKTLIIDNYVSIEKATNISKVLFAIGLLAIMLVDYMILFPIIIMFLVCGRLYVSKSLHLKTNSWMNFIFYFILGYFSILSGVFYKRYDSKIFELIVESLPYMIPFLLLSGSVVLAINILDSNGDKISNRNTFALSLGVRLASALATLLSLCSLLIGLYLNEPLASVLSISIIPFFLFLLARAQNKDIIRSVRYPILLLNFYVMMIYPLLFYPILITFYFTKYYYWHRFSLHYPTLLVDND